MKKIALCLVFALNMAWPLRPAAAEVALPIGSGPYTPKERTGSDVFAHVGPLNFYVPWNHLNAVYLYDFNRDKNLVGGEINVVGLWVIDGTVGALTDAHGKGAPFVGGTLWLPNPFPKVDLISQLRPAFFGGWDWNREAPVWGIKSSSGYFLGQSIMSTSTIMKIVGIVLVCVGIHFGLGNPLALIVFGSGLAFIFLP